MTTEEKAKRYDDVLNKLRHFIAQGVNPLITIANAQDFFPELAESEDEKIRKELLQIVKENEDSFYMVMTPNKRERLIAWLEKQGMGISGATKQELKYNLHKALEKETPESWNKFLDGGEQKPAWSEDDIVAIDCAVDVLNKDLPTLAASIERLKSLRPQNRWKPSEEQMLAIDTAINVLGKGTLNGKQLIELQEQLKKLKE